MSELLIINGFALPPGTKYDVSEMDLVDAERTQTGLAVIDYIATKVKIEVELEQDLSDALLASIISIIGNKNGALQTQYVFAGEARTGYFYSGDRSWSLVQFKNGIPHWRGLKFDLIER